MNEKDIIIDPIITHNNYLIEVAPDEFVNVTQLWREYEQLSKDNNILQNRIDKAIKELEKEYENLPNIDEYYSTDKEWHYYFFKRNEQAEENITNAINILKGDDDK